MRKERAYVVWILAAIVSVLMWGTSVGFAQEMAQKEDKTLAPYFFVQSDNPEVDALPLKATSAHVNIAGVIADVVVTQEYQNEGRKPLDSMRKSCSGGNSSTSPFDSALTGCLICAFWKSKSMPWPLARSFCSAATLPMTLARTLR